jgi:hypothetical protein
MKCLVQQVKVKKIFKLIICKKGLSGFSGDNIASCNSQPCNRIGAVEKALGSTY